jgi:hypothetical protein
MAKANLIVASLSEKQIAHFWEKVRKGGPDDCWLWTGSTAYYGYGGIRAGGRGGALIGTHRFSYILAYGPIPDGMRVLHRCDNPPCVNPAHLFLGTQKDNVADMVKKGRYNGPFGAKLSPDDVREIRRIYKKGMGRELARKFNVCPSMINYIVTRKVWRHVA